MFTSLQDILSPCVCSPKEKRGNYPEMFKFVPGCIPDGSFVLGCNKIEDMVRGFTQDIRDRGAGAQLVSEKLKHDNRHV